MCTKNLVLIKTPKERAMLKEIKKEFNKNLHKVYGTKRIGNRQFNTVTKLELV